MICTVSLSSGRICCHSWVGSRSSYRRLGMEDPSSGPQICCSPLKSILHGFSGPNKATFLSQRILAICVTHHMSRCRFVTSHLRKPRLHKSRRWKRMAPMIGSTIQYRMAQIKRAVEIGWIEVKGVSKSLNIPRCWRILYKKEGIRKYEAPCHSASVGMTRLTIVVMFCTVGPVRNLRVAHR